MVIISLILVIVMAGGSIIYFDLFHAIFKPVEPAVPYQAKEIKDSTIGDQLDIMTWNIKFGGGRIDFFFECHGDREIMEKDEVITHLKGIAQKIRQSDPDIIFLQEVDIKSHRSGMVDQVQWLLDHTDLNYGLYASQWRVDYVPKHNIKKINSGNAILSKYPLKKGTRYALPLIDSQDVITRYFYLRRNMLEGVIDFQGRALYLLNTHTSAFSGGPAKREQLDLIVKHLQKYQTQNQLFVAGGDFNTMPPQTVQRKNFPDDKCGPPSDFSDQKMWMAPFYQDFTPAIPLSTYKRNNTLYFTHTTDKAGFWNRKLDYLFTNAVFNDGLTHQNIKYGGIETMPLSDHAPISAILKQLEQN